MLDEGDTEGLVLEDGLWDALGETEGLVEADGDRLLLGEVDALGEEIAPVNATTTPHSYMNVAAVPDFMPIAAAFEGYEVEVIALRYIADEVVRVIA